MKFLVTHIVYLLLMHFCKSHKFYLCEFAQYIMTDRCQCKTQNGCISFVTYFHKQKFVHLTLAVSILLAGGYPQGHHLDLHGPSCRISMILPVRIYQVGRISRLEASGDCSAINLAVLNSDVRIGKTERMPEELDRNDGGGKKQTYKKAQSDRG